MKKRQFLMAAIALAAASVAQAQDPIKIGLIVPMTGPFASTGRQVENNVKLFQALNGSTVAGRKVEVLLKDDAGVADTTRRLAQEMILKDKVSVLAGFGLTPLAFSTAPIATQSKTPMVVMNAATAVITERSPFIVRSGFTLPQVTAPAAEWATKSGLKRVVTLVADYGPGLDAEKTFVDSFKQGGGEVVETLRVPMANPDFAPFLQRVRDAKPEAVFVFVPSGMGASFMKQFAERGLAQAGIRVIATGDVVDDDLLNDMGEAAVGVISAFHYSAALPSAINKKYVADYAKANRGERPNFHGVGAYDGMQLIYEGLKKTKGEGGQALIDAMKTVSFESPRGKFAIDPKTREVVQEVRLHRVERMNGQLFNVPLSNAANP